ncbi:MAG: polysaccharide export protein [Xanthomonadales bacterium]|nr:polysaccharide export protein [Xanthomonadales bacterium]NNL94730.1 polysaccharide export protein [Xanthomonadales bacterium]
MYKKSFIKLVLLLGLSQSLAAWSAIAQESADQGAYRLGPGDSISIQVFGEDDLSRQLTLGEDGRINYAFVGQIQLAGQSIEEVEKTITDRLRGDYLINPQVSVTMAGYRPFFINGEVNEPGSYPYQPGLTVAKAISLAGGLTERASDKKIFLIPDGGLESNRLRVSLDDAVEPGVTITIEQSFF